MTCFLQVIDANNRSIEEVHKDVVNVVKDKFDDLPEEIGTLWWKFSLSVNYFFINVI